MPFFILISAAAAAGLNFLLYRCLIMAFGLETWSGRFWLLGIFLFLGVSFIISSALNHWRENSATLIYYSVSAFWLGVLANLFLALIIWGILVLGGRLVGIDLSLPLIGMILVGASLLLSAYGCYNAFTPKIKKIEVSLPNLPEVWKGKKIIQLSDVHLGTIYGPRFLQKLVKQVNNQEPDLILITGDLFDGFDGRLSDFAPGLKELKAKRGEYFIAGNHEVYLGLDKIRPLISEANINYLENDMVNLDGLQIVGSSFEASNQTVPLEKLLSNPKLNPADPIILMHHVPDNIAAAKAHGVNLELSGHTHRAQIWPLEIIAWLVYGKYEYGLTIEDSYQIYTSSGVGTWGPPMRTFNSSEIVEIILK